MNRIYDDQLRDLIISRHIFRQANAVWKPHIGSYAGGDLAQWMVQNYLAFAATAIRRISEAPLKRPRKGQRTLSLVILLEEFRQKNAVLTRNRFIEMYPPRLRRFADGHFSKLAAHPSARCMPRLRIRGDITAIKKSTESIKRLVDRVIAHTEEDRRKKGRLTWELIDRTVDLVAEVYQRYYLLLNATSTNPFDVEQGIDVTADLRKVWP